jgi:hypothetical protein
MTCQTQCDDRAIIRRDHKIGSSEQAFQRVARVKATLERRRCGAGQIARCHDLHACLPRELWNRCRRAFCRNVEVMILCTRHTREQQRNRCVPP